MNFQQQGQGQSQQISMTPQFNERDIVNEMVTLEKHAANLCHTAAIEASTPSLYQCCSNIMQETLNCQRNLFQLMSQKGWYNTQNADQQQVNQAYQQYQGYMQSQFPTGK